MDNRKLVIKLLGILVIIILLVVFQKRFYLSKATAYKSSEATEFIGPGEVIDEYDFGSYTVYVLNYKEWVYRIDVKGKVMYTPSSLREISSRNEIQITQRKNHTYVFSGSESDSVEISYSDSHYNKSTELVYVIDGKYQLDIDNEVRVTSVIDNQGNILFEDMYPDTEIFPSTIVSEDGLFLFDYLRIEQNQVTISLRIQDPMNSFSIWTISFEGTDRDYSSYIDHATKLGYGSLYTGLSTGTNSFDNPYIFTVITEKGNFDYDYSDIEVILKEG